MVTLRSSPRLCLRHLCLHEQILIIILTRRPSAAVGIGEATDMVVVVVELLLYLLNLLLLEELLLLPAIVVDRRVILIVLRLLALIQNSVAAWVHLQLLLVLLLVLGLLLLPSEWVAWVGCIVGCGCWALSASIAHRHGQLLLLLLSHHLFELHLVCAQHHDSAAPSPLMMGWVWLDGRLILAGSCSSLALFGRWNTIPCRLLGVVHGEILRLRRYVGVLWRIHHPHHLLIASQVHRQVLLMILNSLWAVRISDHVPLGVLLVAARNQVSSSAYWLSHRGCPLMGLLRKRLHLLVLLGKLVLIKFITLDLPLDAVSWHFCVYLERSISRKRSTSLREHLRPSICVLRSLGLWRIIGALASSATGIIQILIILHSLYLVSFRM